MLNGQLDEKRVAGPDESVELVDLEDGLDEPEDEDDDGDEDDEGLTL